MLLLLVLAFQRSIREKPWLMLLLLSVEVISINALIAINGAASNPYNAILLVPLVLAFMLLPLLQASLLLLLSISAQVLQVFLLPTQGHHQSMMQEHSYAMVGSFVLTSLLIGVVVCYFHFQIANRDTRLQKLRERQLRDEQLLAIGTAAAQLTHDVATPAQSIRFLLEEGNEQQCNKDWLAIVDREFQRIEQHLLNWRNIADDVREKRQHKYALNELTHSLQQLIQIARPEADIQWHTECDVQRYVILADRTLLPALTSVIINACEAALQGENKRVNVVTKIHDAKWYLQIENQGNSLSHAKLASLGTQLMASRNGHGVGAVLSNATIEKFSGEVKWQLKDGIMITTVCIPIDNFHA